MLSFLGRCYQEQDIVEMKKGLRFLRKRPVTSSLYLENTLVDCYEYLLKRNYVKLDDTVEALKLCGYEKFVANFE